MSDSPIVPMIATDAALTPPEQIRALSDQLGFADIRFSPAQANQHLENYQRWIDAGFNGTM